jgi:hypothetical protein
VHEILWSYYRAHDHVLIAEKKDQIRRFYTEISRRAIRPSPKDEIVSFGRWVIRRPTRIGYSYGGMGQGFWGWGDDGYDEDEEHSE